MSNEPVYIGEIKRTYGVKGELQLKLKDGIYLADDELKFLLISEKNAPPVPWFPEKMTPHADGYLVKLEGVNTEKDARRFSGSRVFCAPELVEEEDNLSVEGFDVEDEKLGKLGSVNAVLEYPGQVILSVITSEGKEILLPFNDSFIKEVDEESKKIFYSAPEGLIDVYLNPGPEDEQDDGME